MNTGKLQVRRQAHELKNSTPVVVGGSVEGVVGLGVVAGLVVGGLAAKRF